MNCLLCFTVSRTALSLTTTMSADISWLLECAYVDYSFGEFLRSLLGQVVSDATSDETVFVLAREFSAIGCVDGMRRTVRVPLHGDCRHRNHRTRGQSLLQFVVLR